LPPTSTWAREKKAEKQIQKDLNKIVKHAAAMIVAFRHNCLRKHNIYTVRERYRMDKSIDYAAWALHDEETEGVIPGSSHIEGHAAGYFTCFKLLNAVPWEAKTLQQRFDSLFLASKKAAAIEQSPGAPPQCVDSLDKRLGTYNFSTLTRRYHANDYLAGRFKWPFIGICLIILLQGYASFYHWMRS
jgi:hypothetical protein